MPPHHRVLAVAGLVLLAGTAAAQSLPRPAEFYFDEDRVTTRPLVPDPQADDKQVQRLLRLAARDARARSQLAQVARAAMQAGRVELGRTLYARALDSLGTDSVLWRPLRWNYAWDLYRTGDYAAALEEWARVATARGTTPAWAPPTFALALWTLGRRDEAVQWYAAAVRTEPALWRDTSRYQTLLPDWTESERALLAEVQAAWAANPPAWP